MATGNNFRSITAKPKNQQIAAGKLATILPQQSGDYSK